MISLIFIFAASLIFIGIVNRTKSLASGRKGPGLIQHLSDYRRLFRKGSVYSTTTSFVFRIAPVAYAASVISALFLLPVGGYSGLLSFNADFVAFAYMLALGRFFSILGALDTGSSFEGMGASRESLYAMLAEPAFFVLMGSFALLTGHTSFEQIFMQLHQLGPISYAFGSLAGFVLVLLAMIENSRLPVDDPKTHLELTMIHEVMILDYSGFDLGLIMYSNSIKFAMYGALISNFFIPAEAPINHVFLFFAATQVAFAITVGLIESFMARFRMSHNPQFILALTSATMLLFAGVIMYLYGM